MRARPSRQQTHPPSFPQMSQPTFFVPIAFARPSTPSSDGAAWLRQDPSNRSDTPSGGSTQQPAGGGGAGAAGTQQPNDPNNAPQPQQGPCASNEMMWIMPIFLVLMWLFMIRPEQKRRKEQQQLLSSVKQGDKVVMLSGMHGVVSRLTDKTVTLRIDTIEMEFDRSAIQRIERGDGAPAGKA